MEVLLKCGRPDRAFKRLPYRLSSAAGQVVPEMDQSTCRLNLRIVEARNLPGKVANGKHLYVSVEFQKSKKKTSSAKATPSPRWDADFAFTFKPGSEVFSFNVFVKEPIFKDTLVGTCFVPVSVFIQRPEVDLWVPLEKKAKELDQCGEIHLACRCEVSGGSQSDLRSGGSTSDTDSWVVLPPPDQRPAPPAGQPYASPYPYPYPPLVVTPYSSPSLVIPGANAFASKGGVGAGMLQPPEQPAVSVDFMPPPVPVDESREQKEALVRLLDDEEVRERRRREEEEERLFREFLANEYKCQACGRSADPETLFAATCEHVCCAACLLLHARTLIAANPTQRVPVTCIRPQCERAGTFTDGVLMRVLPAEEFDAYVNRSLQEALTGEAFFRCPKCDLIMERVSPAPSRASASSSSSPSPARVAGAPSVENISEEAARHRDEFRFRCRNENCQTEFCASCRRTPYHLGYTCEAYEAYLRARKCRFCQESLQKPPAASPALEVCDAAECLEKLRLSCGKMLPCGHPCGGCSGEQTCLPCLQEGCGVAGLTQSGADFCNICWVEELAAAPCVLLRCGHLFHYACVRKKLSERWPHARITFGFMNCPLCKQHIEHPLLEDLLQPIRKLKDEIAAKAMQRLEFEGLKNDPEITQPTGRYYKNPQGFAMDKFAYYPCYKCGRPYFGGQRRCDAGEQNRPFDPKDLVCPSCAGGALAASCSIHGKEFIEYKCAFCCNVSTWFCWGKTHFCDECHARQQRGDYMNKKPRSELPVCPGPEKCPLRRPHPPNGEEFSLGCALCANQNSF